MYFIQSLLFKKYILIKDKYTNQITKMQNCVFQCVIILLQIQFMANLIGMDY